MAKKSRTPAPPRKVQAPQRRTDPKKRRSAESRRQLMLTTAFAAAGLAAAGIAAAVVFAFGGGGSNTVSPIPNSSDLVGVQTGPAPWNQGLDTLSDRLDPLGLNDLTTEGQVIHIHQHLDIFLNGKRLPIPQNIGVFAGQFLTELHTHDPLGIIHVESPTRRSFNLGQFFGVWGVRFGPDCIGGYCRQVTPWTVYVNGQAYQGANPAAIELKEHEELAIVIGTPPKTIPRKYKFPPGL